MRRVLVDSNVLLSYLTDREPRQRRLAADLIEGAAANGVVLLLHQQVLSELVFVLRRLYDRGAQEAAATLAELLALPSAEPVDALPWTRLLELWPAELPDFADACLAAAARAAQADAIATFDRSFSARLRRLPIAAYWD